jgi:hypothetical protein
MLKGLGHATVSKEEFNALYNSEVMLFFHEILPSVCFAIQLLSLE